MNGFWPVFKRDLFAIFVTPMAWVLFVIFLVLEGLNFYWLSVHFANQVDLAVDHGPIQWFFGETVLFYLPLLMLPPALTMRSSVKVSSVMPMALSGRAPRVMEIVTGESERV